MTCSNKIVKIIAVLAGVTPGFIATRMLLQRQREAQKPDSRGSPLPWENIDPVSTTSASDGPFRHERSDRLDLSWIRDRGLRPIRDVLRRKDRRARNRRRLLRLGRSSGTPFPSRSPISHPRLSYTKSGGIPRANLRQENPGAETIYPMINDRSEDPRRRRPSALRTSIGLVENGYGWPVYRGRADVVRGDQVGHSDKVAGKMKSFQRRPWARPTYQPSALARKTGR